MKLIAVVLGVVVAGCSETLPFHGDVTFTAEERAAIEQGTGWLAEHIGRDPFAIVWDLPHPEVANAPSLSIIRTVDARAHGFGYYDGQGRILIDGDGVALNGGEMMAAVAAHELGHYEGLSHHPGPGIMSDEGLRPILHWTDEDRDQCVAAHVTTACAPE